MKKLITPIFAITLLLAYTTGTAQTYTFSKHTETYTEISSVAPAFLQSPKYADTLALGFNMKIAGATGNKLYVVKRGSISLAGMPVTDFVFETFSTEHSQGAYTYTVTGAAGSRIAKLQFKNVKFDHDFTAGDYMNYQVWLYEANNTIEVHFGTSSVNNPDESYYYQMGGPAIGTKGFWLKGSAAAPTTDTAAGTRIAGTPANGMVYTFTPTGTGINHTDNAQGITLYPVPAKSIVHIGGLKKKTSYRVYDMKGSVVLVDATNSSIDVSKLQVGNYVLQLDMPDGVEKMQFVKE